MATPSSPTAAAAAGAAESARFQLPFKRLMRGAVREQLVNIVTLENENFAARLASAEAKAAFAAFLDKRPHSSR